MSSTMPTILSAFLRNGLHCVDYLSHGFAAALRRVGCLDHQCTRLTRAFALTRKLCNCMLMHASREGHAKRTMETISTGSQWRRIIVRSGKLPFVQGNSKAASLSRYILKQPDART
jgi:hypothetical protein